MEDDMNAKHRSKEEELEARERATKEWEESAQKNINEREEMLAARDKELREKEEAAEGNRRVRDIILRFRFKYFLFNKSFLKFSK